MWFDAKPFQMVVFPAKPVCTGCLECLCFDTGASFGEIVGEGVKDLLMHQGGSTNL